jgi:hypothetical protein
MAHRTVNLPSRKVTYGGKGVTTFHDLKSQLLDIKQLMHATTRL